MNINNMKLLRNQLSRLNPEQFDMAEWMCHPEDIGEDRRLFEPQLVERVERCGTVACIAGWASLLNGGPTYYEVKAWAANWLELTPYEAANLFFGHWADRKRDNLSDITLDDAVAHLDLLIGSADQQEEAI